MGSERPKRKEKQNPADDEIRKQKNQQRRKATQILVIVGIIDSASLVLWAKSEDFSYPYDYYIRWLAYCGLLVGCAFGVYKFLKIKRKKLKPRTKAAIWVSWGVLCIVLFFTKSPPPITSATARFTLMLRTDDAPLTERVELTNDFLYYTDFGKIHKILGALFVPILPGQTNVRFVFLLRNDTKFPAENSEVGIFVQKSANPIPGPGWAKVAPKWILADTEKFGFLETNEMECFGCRLDGALLPSDGAELPPIKISPQLPLIPSIPQAVIIEARAKNWPPTAMDFVLFFLPNSIFATNDFHRPFVASKANWPSSSSSPTLRITPEMLKKLQE